MAAFSSYQVKIAGSDGVHSVSTTIADSSSLVVTWVCNLWEVISEYQDSLNDDEEGIAHIVGLTIECCDDDGDGSASSINKNKQVATLQLSYGSSCILIQLLHLKEIPSNLKSLLANDHRTFVFVGVGVREACVKLERDYGLKCKSMIELAPMASRACGKSQFFDLNLKELANEITGINIEKPNIPSLSLWGARDLRNEQISYAATKAYASCLIGNKLMGRY